MNGWEALENRGAIFESCIRATLQRLSLPLTFHRIGSMFCLFFTDRDVSDLDSARMSNTEEYARYFHRCLKNGVYFAPSQFETGFISLAHTEADLRTTAEIAADALQLANI